MSGDLWLARHGFDTPRLRFGLRTALASCVALLLGWLLGLEHPQWSAMTVWAASQPVRGLLIEKSFFRAVGTVIGTGFGILLTLAAGGDTLTLAIGLAIWVGLCAGAGNALQGLPSYGMLLAGYSASMVALLNTTDHSGIFALGIDRLSTVMLGVLVALITGLLFNARTKDGDEGNITGRTRRISALVLHHMAARLGHRRTIPSTGLDELLGEVAAIEETMDAHGAGSLRSRQSAHSIRAVLVAQMAAILWLKHPTSVREDGEDASAIAKALADAALALDTLSSINEILRPLTHARALSTHIPALSAVLNQIAEAMEQRDRFHHTGTADVELLKKHFVLHRDWVYARQTMFRTGGVLLLIGLAWVATGWKLGAYVLLGTSVMVSLFSTFENPAWIMRRVLLWQAIGASAALICRWLVWPAATTEVQMLLMMMPFVVISVIPFAHRATMWGSMDYTMVLLLLLQPRYPLHGVFSDSLATALAVVAAPLLAFIAFKLIFPADAARRQETLKDMMIHEVQNLAADPDAFLKRHIWRIRLYHRIMKMVHWSIKSGEGASRVTGGSLAVLDVGSAILDLQQLRQERALSAREIRNLQATLRRVADIRTHPERVARTLKRMGRLLQDEHQSLASQMQYAAQGLLSNLNFFRIPG